MTRSIFDPDGGETERSGSRFGSEDAQNRSHMPPDTVDGRVSEEEQADVEGNKAKNDPDAAQRDEQSA